jgi:transposase
MKPVIGIDVAKGMSVVQAFLKRSVPYGRDERVMHTPKGFERLREIAAELEAKTGMLPRVILEPTGHYHRVLVAYLQKQGIEVILVNPLQAQRARRTGLRKVKTDASDAWHLGDLFYQEENWAAQPIRQERLLDLQFLTRQHEFLTSLYVQAKLNMRCLVDQVFPSYSGVFRDLFSKTSLRFLESYLSSGGMISEQSDERWAEAIRESTKASRSKAWVQKKTELLKTAVSLNPVGKVAYGLETALRSMLATIRELQDQVAALEKLILELTETIPEVKLIESIPGIGTKLSAAIIAEIGDASQFSHPKQVVAFAGLDPSVFSSGKFTASENRITKRGSKRLRRASFLAVTCGLRGDLNVRIREYYDKKKSEGKPHKVAVIACANKLLHHVYAMLKKGQPYTL